MYDGSEMFFTGSQWDMMLMAQFLWRYGWDTYRILDYVKGMLSDFSRLELSAVLSLIGSHTFCSFNNFV